MTVSRCVCRHLFPRVPGFAMILITGAIDSNGGHKITMDVKCCHDNDDDDDDDDDHTLVHAPYRTYVVRLF